MPSRISRSLGSSVRGSGISLRSMTPVGGPPGRHIAAASRHANIPARRRMRNAAAAAMSPEVPATAIVPRGPIASTSHPRIGAPMGVPPRKIAM
ncbi:hypothetical protein USB125703_01109 [Pseudoclavibacter triregionum]|nr:hypothetical protein USB125703_01109 [Pseudoclavibacter triregionum]